MLGGSMTLDICILSMTNYTFTFDVQQNVPEPKSLLLLGSQLFQVSVSYSLLSVTRTTIASILPSLYGIPV